MLSMFSTFIIMMACLVKYERSMPPFALLNFIAVIVDTMIAYMLTFVNLLLITSGILNLHVGIFAMIFYVFATVSILLVVEGKRSGRDSKYGTFSEKQGFLAKLF